MPDVTFDQFIPLDRKPGPFDPSPSEAATLAEIRRRESGNNYAARNPDSTASGGYQFINSTWRMASDATGVPKYATAAEAPQAVQDANALHMLRRYGPNAKITWAESGPYDTRSKTAATTAAAVPASVESAPAADSGDILSRIARGENIEVTPQMIAQIIQGSEPAPAPAPKAKPEEETVTFDKSVPLPPTTPTGITDALKNESFLDSAWNAVKSIVTAPKSILTGEYQQLTHQQLQQQAQLAKSGTPEQKRAWARDVLLQNIPFASTVYKALYGNLPGAAGDIAGFAALGAIPTVVEKGPAAVKGAATGAAQAATEMVPLRRMGVSISVPKPVATAAAGAAGARLMGLPAEVGAAVGGVSPIIRGAFTGAREALAARAARLAQELANPPVMQPLPPSQQLPAGAIMTPPPPDTSYVRGVPAEYATPEPLPVSRRLPAGPPVTEMPAAADTSYVRAVPAEYPEVVGPAVEQPAAPARPPMPTLDEIAMGSEFHKPYAKLTPDQQALINSTHAWIARTYDPNWNPEVGPTTQAVGPPVLEYNAPGTEPQPAPQGKTAAEMLQQEMAAKRAATTPPALPPAAIPEKVTPAEGEQAFEQAKSEQPQIAEPGRTQYTATGEVKSPQLRGAEIKLRNIEAKAQRWSQALRALGLQPADVPRIQPGWVSAEAQAAGAAPGWENVMHDLIGRGLLDKGERRPPVESLTRIQELMRNTPAAAKAEFQAAKSAPPKK